MYPYKSSRLLATMYKMLVSASSPSIHMVRLFPGLAESYTDLLDAQKAAHHRL
jgi:hypothetical protein